MVAIGYVRVFTREQSLALQHDALTEAGCTRVVTDVACGARAGRPQLAAALGHLRPGDVLVLWRLDRFGRTMRHLVGTVDILHERGVRFRSLREDVDTAAACGKLTFHLFAVFAESEWDLLRERARAGLAALAGPKRRGVMVGEPVALVLVGPGRRCPARRVAGQVRLRRRRRIPGANALSGSAFLRGHSSGLCGVADRRAEAERVPG